jgi:hypothetical protein
VTRGRKEAFFFVKKNQKTFVCWAQCVGNGSSPDQQIKVFLLLFLQKKKSLPSFLQPSQEHAKIRPLHPTKPPIKNTFISFHRFSGNFVGARAPRRSGVAARCRRIAAAGTNRRRVQER